MASGFKITTVILFSLAVLCLLAAIGLFFIWHIREVRDTLTGKTAQHRIAELRSTSGRWQQVDRHAVAAQSALDEPWNTDDIDRQLDLDSLGVNTPRSLADDDAGADEERVGTTLLADSVPRGNAAGTSMADDEEERLTSLLTWPQGTVKQVNENVQQDDAEDAAGTTLLGGKD